MESEVRSLAANGRSHAEIAKQTKIGKTTVRKILLNIYLTNGAKP